MPGPAQHGDDLHGWPHSMTTLLEVRDATLTAGLTKLISNLEVSPSKLGVLEEISMNIEAALDDMKSMRARRTGLGTAEMLEALYKTREQRQRNPAEEDEAVLQSVVFHNSSNFVRRLDEDDDIEHCFFEEVELKHQDRKRRTGEPLENNVNKKNGALQAVNSLMKRNAEPGDKGHPPQLKSSGVEAPFAVSPKPLTFSVIAAAERKTKGEIISGKLNEGGDKMTQENVNGKAEVASSGHSALCLAYDSDSD